jgi:hypothetical protein
MTHALDFARQMGVCRAMVVMAIAVVVVAEEEGGTLSCDDSARFSSNVSRLGWVGFQAVSGRGPLRWCGGSLGVRTYAGVAVVVVG